MISNNLDAKERLEEMLVRQDDLFMLSALLTRDHLESVGYFVPDYNDVNDVSPEDFNQYYSKLLNTTKFDIEHVSKMLDASLSEMICVYSALQSIKSGLNK